MLNHFISLIFCLLMCCSCNNNSNKKDANSYKGEYIARSDHDVEFYIAPQELLAPPTYPWEDKFAGKHPKITKDFFRCKGSTLNPTRTTKQKEETVRYEDCSGSEKHSLPLHDQKEFIYPILIELLNEIQYKTGKRVVITSGHRCPEHNLYVDQSQDNQASKHQIGAEVSFYVQGMEDKPEYIIRLIQQHYQQPQYKDQKSFQEFQRYDKGSNVATLPWHNKEIFIKLFRPHEGRNFDNRHPYAYISIQVRYDRDTKEKVIYTWEKANKHFHRK